MGKFKSSGSGALKVSLFSKIVYNGMVVFIFVTSFLHDLFEKHNI